MELAGRGALVTGGASGLGLATARSLRAAGASVGVIDRRHAEEWDGPFEQADVSDEDQVRRAITALRAELGSLHVAVNCAGTGTSSLAVGDGASLSPRRFRRILDVNTLGTFIVAQLAAEAMLANDPDADGERGVIINTASTVGLEGQIGTTAYAASKGAVIAMTLPFARELARFGIRVVTIAPGIFETTMFGGAPDHMQAWLRDQVPFPARTGRPDEFAAMARHIVENSMLNGETIRLDAALRVASGDPAWSAT